MSDFSDFSRSDIQELKGELGVYLAMYDGSMDFEGCLENLIMGLDSLEFLMNKHDVDDPYLMFDKEDL